MKDVNLSSIQNTGLNERELTNTVNNNMNFTLYILYTQDSHSIFPKDKLSVVAWKWPAGLTLSFTSYICNK